MRKRGFTLAEVLICLVVIGIIATILMTSLKPQSYNQKAFVSNVRKIVDNFQNASYGILEEKKHFPMSVFIYEKPTGNPPTITSIYADDATNAITTSEQVVNMYGKYIKYEESDLNFCTYSGACSDNNVKGARIPGGAYIGFKINTSLFNCPSYKIPDPKATSGASVATATGKGKCWATFYVDVNGKDGPNVLGEDYYEFGMNAVGVAL